MCTIAELILGKSAGYTSTDYKTNAQITKELKKHQFWTSYWNTREAGYNM